MSGDVMSGDVTRRGFLLAATATATAGVSAAVSWGNPAWAGAASAADGFAARFAAPGHDVRPRFRWWWPDGMVDPAEIAREVDQIAAAGFGGAEIAAVHHSLTAPLDVKTYGWGSAAWIAGLEAALRQAARRGVTIDLTIGPAWPAAVPTITPDSPAAVKELAHGMTAVAGGATYDGPVPTPHVPAAPGVATQRVLVVQAARISPGGSPATRPVPLDAGSVQDLTGLVAGDGRLRWTAPPADADGQQWLIIAYWERGSGQRPERGPHSDPDSYVVDHFSRAGTQAVIDFWESTLLTPAVRALLPAAGGALFEDSIELETDATNWTPGLPEEFDRRMGYALSPYLPVVVTDNEKPVFTFDAALTRHVRRDYWETLSQLFIENHFAVLTRLAHSIGLELRAQPYGMNTDAIAAAALIDIPEGESLGFKNLDDYRCLAGGRDLGGRLLLSNELGAYAGGAYNTTWEKVLRTAGGEFAAGVNQAVLHGFSYAAAPDARWPGFAAFTPYDGKVGYAESWGPRQPTWRHVRDVSAYLARNQFVLRTGGQRADAVILRQQGYTKTGLGAPWFTSDGVPTGWTHQLIGAAMLRSPRAKVAGGRLAPDGPAYKVLVFEGDIFAGREHTLGIDTAERLRALARAGLPVIAVGDWSDARVPGLERPGENDRLRALLAELFALPSVRVVADRPNIPGALTDLGLRPDVEYAQRSTLLNLRRVAAGPGGSHTDYYYFSNGKHAENSKVDPVDHAVALTRTDRRAIPYRLDAWTGRIERIAEYTEDGDRVGTRIALRPGQTTIVALAPPGALGEGAAGGPYATSTEADEVRFADGVLTVRATRAGTFATTLSTGRIVQATIADVPAASTLSRWRLAVEDWQPGATATETVVAAHVSQLDALTAWPDIPELQDVSGVGRYTATLELTSAWTGGYGAYLDLGEVFDTCRVTVGGRRLPPVDQLYPVVDIGPYLRHGTNAIEVEVATTLNNRLRVADPAVYGAAARQRYGLIGPVRLIPYGQVVIHA